MMPIILSIPFRNGIRDYYSLDEILESIKTINHAICVCKDHLMRSLNDCLGEEGTLEVDEEVYRLRSLLISKALEIKHNNSNERTEDDR